MEKEIAMTVQVMRSNLNSSEQILKTLVERGLERTVAAHLITLVPIVYGREGLSGCGISFSMTYIGESGRECRLNSLPFWGEIVAFARSEIANGATSDDLLAVAGRSSEIDAINKALHAGSKIENLVISPPVFLWPELSLTVNPSSPAKNSPRWWELWKQRA
jgi:hypothetical protein